MPRQKGLDEKTYLSPWRNIPSGSEASKLILDTPSPEFWQCPYYSDAHMSCNDTTWPLSFNNTDGMIADKHQHHRMCGNVTYPAQEAVTSNQMPPTSFVSVTVYKRDGSRIRITEKMHVHDWLSMLCDWSNTPCLTFVAHLTWPRFPCVSLNGPGVRW